MILGIARRRLPRARAWSLGSAQQQRSSVPQVFRSSGGRGFVRALSSNIRPALSPEIWKDEHHVDGIVLETKSTACQQFEVTTYARKDIATHATNQQHAEADDNTTRNQQQPAPTSTVIPLTITDVHLIQEQLPFAYFFRETLDAGQLEDSLRRVLQHFPVVGGRIDTSCQAIECRDTDSVSLAFGSINGTLSEWLRDESRGHVHVAGSGHPELLPLFDSLFLDNNENNNHPLASFRVTYFQGGGTAIGVNMLHALGDTASCVRLVHCWGREMQQLAYPKGACNRRANASLAGMMTGDLAELMGLNSDATRKIGGEKEPSMLSRWCDWLDFAGDRSTATAAQSTVILPLEICKPDDDEGNHEYLIMNFPPSVLEAMKAVGMADCLQQQQPTGSFVSTNDMLTAFGWMVKRSLSQQLAWNISVVVNLRGRCGVAPFSDMNMLESISGAVESATEEGLFGNGITNVVASYPPSVASIGISDISGAALSIRNALTGGMLDIPDRLSSSKMGRPTPAPVSAIDTFATTSWGQFPLWDISFSDQSTLAAFHGHPSHPLPLGASTYASVIVMENTNNEVVSGGINYKLLLPSNKAAEARRLHQVLCDEFLQAHQQLQKQALCT